MHGSKIGELARSLNLRRLTEALTTRSVKGHPRYGENSALYSAMGYVPASERSSGLTRRRETETPKKEATEAS